MNRLSFASAVSFCWFAGALSAWGQAESGLLPPPLMARYGLTRAWHAQVELNRAVGRMAHVTQHLSATRAPRSSM